MELFRVYHKVQREVLEENWVFIINWIDLANNSFSNQLILIVKQFPVNPPKNSKMKVIAIVIFALIAAASSAPIQVSNNNVGDIITVGISANAVLSSQVEANIINVIAGLVNQQAIVAALNQGPTPAVDAPANPITDNITPKLISALASFLPKPEASE